jgi:hypothetical protein
MSDAFESHLEDLFNAGPDMADAEQFAARIEHQLNRARDRWVFAAIAGAVIAAGLTFPLVERVLAKTTESATALLEHPAAMTLNTSLATAAGMTVIAVAALVYGRYQAARL